MYSLHITRQDLHFKEDETKRITKEEWDSLPMLPEYYVFVYGNIRVTNPNEETIKEMKQIAEKLGAKVQGDDGEEY